MTIATEKIKAKSDRFMLIRMRPGRYVEPAFVSGTLYQMTFPFPVAAVSRNGVFMQPVGATPVSTDRYYYDETTQTLQISLASAPNSTSNVVIVYYHLYYTGSIFRSAPASPDITENSTPGVGYNPLREWKPRVQNYPSILQSFSDNFGGIFSLADTSISLVNTDREFQQYLTPDDSFFNKKVDIWLCINGIENIQKVYVGNIIDLSLTSNSVNINVTDVFGKLKQPAYFGDSLDECYYTKTSSAPYVQPEADGIPIPMLVGDYSRHKFLQPFTEDYRFWEGTKSYCIDYDGNKSGSTNRVWRLCRTLGSIATQSVGTIQATAVSGVYRVIRFSSVSGIAAGETLQWVESSVTYYGTVVFVGSFTVSGTPYNVKVLNNADPFTTSSTIVPSSRMGIVIKKSDQDEPTYPLLGLDYTLTTETTSAGGVQRKHKITFVNNFESGYPTITGSLDPDIYSVYFFVYTTAVGHGSYLNTLMTKAGITTDSNSFDDADVALTAKAHLQVPYFDQQDYGTYLDYAQDLLNSTLGYLYLVDGENVTYGLLSAAPSSTDSRDSNLILDFSMNCKIGYQDIITQIVAYNPHHDTDIGTSAASVTEANNKARYLHDIANTDRFRHVLDSFSVNSLSDKHMNLKSNRLVKYSFETASQDIDSELGSEVLLENNIVIGDTSSQSVKIVTLDKTAQKTVIEAVDLLGL